MSKITRQSWVWRFDHPPAKVWAVMADTARFNEAANFPKHHIEEIPQDDGSVAYMARFKRGPVRIEWREVPVDWVAEQRFVHRREFTRGPFRTLTATLELTPEGAGSRIDYTLEVEPVGLVGRALLALGFMRKTGRTFARLADDARDFLAGANDRPFRTDPPKLEATARRRAEAIAARIDESSNGHGIGRRLAEHALSAPDLDAEHIRPLRLAAAWGMKPRHVIEACLQATAEGLFDMDWLLLCSRCRGAKATSPSLDRLPTGNHCPTCNIDFGRDFQRNVELAFRPSAAIREVEGGEFCLFGPMTTPHVKLQQTLDAGEERTVTLDLPFGDYRLRTLHPGGESDIAWAKGGFPEIVADGRTVRAGKPAAKGHIRLRNASERRLTLVLESRQWLREALTAHRVTSLQTFRDLFGGEALRPGDEAGIERLTLMFTDLKGSTALYGRVGDIPAFNLVRDHFAYLTEKIRDNNGAIVKTIGDAVMASFADPADGLRAALAVQRGVAGFNADHGAGGVVIKIGLHAGPCVAVRLNERLDYFGATVNMAARLEGQSQGGDIVLSKDFAADPEVAALLAPLKPATARARLRGIDTPVAFLRIDAA